MEAKSNWLLKKRPIVTDVEPDVSVVIPTYNRRHYVQQAIESCFAGNDEIEVEVVVVDDGSTDGTREYLESIDDEGVRPIFQEHQGAQVARNTGQKAARGRSIKHLDDDDYLVEGALTMQYSALHREGVDVCYGNYYYRDDRERGEDVSRYFENRGGSDLFSVLLSKSVNRLPFAYLFDADAVTGIRWNESLDYLQDVSFMLQAASHGLSCVWVNEPIGVHRLHSGDRITDVRQEEDVEKRLDMICRWHWKAYRDLKERSSELTEEQERAAAVGLWAEAHKLAPFSWDRFEYWHQRIRSIRTDFCPRRENRLLALLDRLATPHFVERLINPIRRYRVGTFKITSTE